MCNTTRTRACCKWVSLDSICNDMSALTSKLSACNTAHLRLVGNLLKLMLLVVVGIGWCYLYDASTPVCVETDSEPFHFLVNISKLYWTFSQSLLAAVTYRTHRLVCVCCRVLSTSGFSAYFAEDTWLSRSRYWLLLPISCIDSCLCWGRLNTFWCIG